ncbi:TSCPD domain-containing protein [Bradyrhizobium sp. 215_C5_N1_1]|uniref:TSCPD domain-containing protein n=1 Tax=unclassified Bradyrhizobium TaxID=2631580 RepID=UPI003F8A53F0
MPNKRRAETITFERDGARFEMTVGYYPDGRVGEVFLNADRANSLLDFLMSDAAILASLALQYGAPLDEIMHALKRDTRGIAASPIGAALEQIR